MQSPIIASVAPTFWMALMVISTFLPNYWVAILVWGISIIGHIGLVGYFYVRFLGYQRVKLQQVYPSWFILFVGFGVGAITSSHFNLLIGKVIFWCALGCYLILLPVVIVRLVRGNLPQATLPLTAILAAPGSLCLDAYVNVFTKPNLFLLVSLLVVSQLLYFVALAISSRFILAPFNSSFAAFTFPLVVSASALTGVQPLLNLGTTARYGYTLLIMIESIIAVVVVCYVLVLFMVHTVKSMRMQVSW